jgi:hypothetical protein
MERFDCGWNNFLLFLVLMSNIVEFSIQYYLLVTINIVMEYIYWAIKGNIPKKKLSAGIFASGSHHNSNYFLL